MKKTIAVTGGIGSGKSVVIEELGKMGYAVFSADEIYKEKLNDEKFVRAIYNALGIEIPDGKRLVFDKKIVAAAVFGDKALLKKLNAVTHPTIMDEIMKRADAVKADAVFCEVPLLFECGYVNMFDYTIVVRRNIEARIKSVETRDGLSEKEILKRIKNQFDYANLSEKGNILILNNDGSRDSLILGINEIIKKIL